MTRLRVNTTIAFFAVSLPSLEFELEIRGSVTYGPQTVSQQSIVMFTFFPVQLPWNWGDDNGDILNNIVVMTIGWLQRLIRCKTFNYYYYYCHPSGVDEMSSS